MTITYRDQITRDLTPAEVDANFRHVLDSANNTFVPSGTGALTRTVSDTLRAIVRTGDFDTAGHFNTAQAALTESIGLKALRIGTGSGIGSGITFPTSSTYGNHAIYVADTTFNGIIDPILIYGYNPGRLNTSEPSCYYGFEGRYFDLTNTWIEHNQDYVSDDGLTSKRFFTQQINRATHLSTWQWSGSSFDFTAVLDGTPSFYINSKSVAVGTIAPDVNVRIQVSGVPDTSATQYGLSVKPTVTATTTNGYLSFNSAPTTVAAAFSMTALAHFNVVDVSKGAGSSITDQWGFRCQDLTAGTNNKAFVGEVSSGANNYNAYFSGTAKNHFAGEVLQGTTTALGIANYGAYRVNGTSGGVYDVMVNGTRTASFYADSTGANFTTLTGTLGHIFNTPGGVQLNILNTASAVNNLTVTGGATGSPAVVTLGTTGTSTDIDVAITPKGAGVLKFGTNTAKAAEAFASYITIKDSGGTSRKVMVCA